MFRTIDSQSKSRIPSDMVNTLFGRLKAPVPVEASLSTFGGPISHAKPASANFVKRRRRLRRFEGGTEINIRSTWF